MRRAPAVERADRVRERAYLGIDVAGALGLTGTMIAYLSLSSLLPVAFAIGYGEPVWPFVGAGALAGGVGLGLMRLGRRSSGPIGFREGQVSRPVDAFFEGM